MFTGACVRYALSAACACLLALPAWGARYRDDAGHDVTLAAPAQRVITLAPSLTEIVYAVGGGARLVGTVTYSDYPVAAQALPRVGDNKRLDLERIAQLKPDLILAWYHGSSQKELERLSALGIPMFYVEPQTLEQVPTALERIGALLGTDAAARRAADSFRNGLADLRTRHRRAAPVRVFYQVWPQPLMTVNGQQIISNVIDLCGGRNIYADQPLTVPQLSTESVVAADPDVIIAARVDHDSASGAKDGRQDAALSSWLRFTSMRAVRTRQIWTVPGDAISRAGPRLLDGAIAMCTAIDAARQVSAK
jgi:iron complex transport system substrate-binding protein